MPAEAVRLSRASSRGARTPASVLRAPADNQVERGGEVLDPDLDNGRRRATGAGGFRERRAPRAPRAVALALSSVHDYPRAGRGQHRGVEIIRVVRERCPLSAMRTT